MGCIPRETDHHLFHDGFDAEVGRDLGRQLVRLDAPHHPPCNRNEGSGLRVQGSGFRVQGAGLRVQGSGFTVQGAGVWRRRGQDVD